MKILVLNGPNLNFLGIREKHIYGNQSYESLVSLLEEKARKEGHELCMIQSNHEGELIDQIQRVYKENIEGLIINPGALTHYSYAILDALLCLEIPVIEVHLSNIYQREDFRKVSVTVKAVTGQISGLGFYSYVAAMDYLTLMRREL